MIRRRPPFVTAPQRRIAPEPVVPMINVVFLLLIFFLMTAQITTPPPFEVDLPQAVAEEEDAIPTLYISATGEIAFESLLGDEALAAAAAQTPLTLQADSRLSAGTLARILADLSQQGASDIRLMTQGGS